LADVFEISALHLRAMIKALREAGLYEEVLAHVSPATRETMDNTYSHVWHPGTVIEEIWRVVVSLHGPAQLADLNYSLSKKTFGPVIMPLVKVALTLSGGGNPASIASRLDALLRLAIREVQILWEQTDKQAGELLINYPRPVVREVEQAWRGVLRFMFELSASDGSVEIFEYLNEGRQLRIVIAWQKK
jgi:hypothetical protein